VSNEWQKLGSKQQDAKNSKGILIVESKYITDYNFLLLQMVISIMTRFEIYLITLFLAEKN
jgi:hypothetical protein